MHRRIRRQELLVLGICYCLMLGPGVSPVQAETVNPANIVIFEDNDPAVAGEVNGNFNELITQINDHDNRIDFIESLGLLAGSGQEPLLVNCDTDPDGDASLQTAINSARNNSDLAFIQATGTCGGIFVGSQAVRISAVNGAPLTIQSDGSSNAIFVVGATLQLVDAGGGITVDANGSGNAIRTGAFSVVSLNGAVNVIGATLEQVVLFQFSQFSCQGACTLGTPGDTATGLRLEQSLGLLFNSAPFWSTTTLTINSNGRPLTLDDSSFETFRLDPAGTVQLAIPAGSEIELGDGSTALLGPATIGAGQLRIIDNSSVSLDPLLFDAGTTTSWTTDVLVERGSSLRLNLEDAASTAVFTHTGELEIGVNSSLELFGPRGDEEQGEYFPGAMTAGLGDDTSAFFGLGGVVTVNGATLATDEVTVFNGTLALAQFARLDASDGTAPAISSVYNGTVLDVISDNTEGTTDSATLSGPAVSCSTGGTAWAATEADACAPPPP